MQQHPPVEKTHEFKGRYHVLMGSISPLKGVSPDQLAIASLLKRLQGGSIEEVIYCDQSECRRRNHGAVPFEIDQTLGNSRNTAGAGITCRRGFGVRRRSDHGEGSRRPARTLSPTDLSIIQLRWACPSVQLPLSHQDDDTAVMDDIV
jgi:hypothetical protein